MLKGKKHWNSGVSEDDVVDYVHESDMALIASLQGDISCVKQDLSRRSHSSVPQRVSHFTNNQYDNSCHGINDTFEFIHKTLV